MPRQGTISTEPHSFSKIHEVRSYLLDFSCDGSFTMKEMNQEALTLDGSIYYDILLSTRRY